MTISFLIAATTALAKFTGDNMNGDVYTIGVSPGADPSLAVGGSQPLPGGWNWRDRPDEDAVEYIDVYSGPITTRYGEVFYRNLDEQRFPDDLVERFQDKIMAIYGFEINQVYKGKNGEPDKDVPMTVSYNHHSGIDIYGSTAETEDITATGPNDMRIEEHKRMHGMATAGNKVKVVKGGDKKGKNSTCTLENMWTECDDIFELVGDHYSTLFGAESRTTPLMAPPGGFSLGFVKSPERYSILAMQIDTWNRDEMDKEVGHFVPGPYPKGTKAPKEAPYSGLLECPMNTRITKKIDADYNTEILGTQCSHKLMSKSECLSAEDALFNFTKQVSEVDTTDLPSGCLISLRKSEDDIVADVVYNKNTQSTIQCGDEDGAATVLGTRSLEELGVEVSVEITKPTDQRGGGKGKRFGGRRFATGQVTITLTGPADVYYAVGFNAKAMGDLPYTIVVTPSGVSERKLGNHAPGDELPPTVNVVSNMVSDGRRTVVLTRDSAITNKDYFSFDTKSKTLPFIAAVGPSASFGFHQKRGADTLTLLTADESKPACICAQDPKPFGKGTGQLVYTSQPDEGRDVSGSVGFNNQCLDSPMGDLLILKNPTCDIREYVGGLNACHDKWFLLDADQEIPWADQELEFELKVRIYFAELNKDHHQPTGAQGWTLGSLPGFENDVPNYNIAEPDAETPMCDYDQGTEGLCIQEDGTPVYVTQALWSIDRKEGQAAERAHQISAHFHVGAISLEVWEWDTDKNWPSKLLCNSTAVNGQGRSDVRFDEKDYIHINYCMFSDDPETGLEAPPVVTDKTFYLRKVSNATHYHTGDMSIINFGTMFDPTDIKGRISPNQELPAPKGRTGDLNKDEAVLPIAPGAGKKNQI